jgi:hypothetical protein
MFLKYHEHFANEVYQATACYVIWKNLQNQPSNDDELLKVLNNNALTWIFIRNSMMQSLIMTLGRIFDTDNDALSIDDLLKSCISEIDIFSTLSLRERKLKSPNAHQWIDSYMESTYQPSEIDFQKLKSKVKTYKIIFNKYYKPLRHQIFAHSDKLAISNTNPLWEATKEANIEDLLNFLEDLKITLQETYHNGRKPLLKDRKIDEDFFTKDIQSLLKTLKGNKFKKTPT